MGAEWPAGAALAMESWPPRSRGFMSGVLQGSWGLGFALSALAYGFLFDLIGWRGLLWIGILPALAVVWIRFYVNEPAVWVENKRKQRETKTEVKAPLFSIFKRGLLFNTLTACFWIASLLRLLFDLGLVLGIPAEGTELDAVDGGHTLVLGKHHRLCRQ
jgi:SHS family lactate transporter-like MFS transporter